MADIFISYKREEQPIARELATALQMKGWSVWWDPEVRAGERFDDVIDKALKESKCVVVLWSKLSVESQNVKDEASYALNRDKLVPIMIEEVDLPYRFERINTGQLIDFDGSDTSAEFQKLVDDIAKIIGSPPAEVEKRKRQHEDERKRRKKEQSKAEEERLRQYEEVLRLAEEKRKFEKELQRTEAKHKAEEERKRKEEEAFRKIDEEKHLPPASATIRWEKRHPNLAGLLAGFLGSTPLLLIGILGNQPIAILFYPFLALIIGFSIGSTFKK